jgi:uncharacterized protein Veg
VVESAEEEVQVELRAQEGRKMEIKHIPVMRKKFSEQKEIRTDEK